MTTKETYTNVLENATNLAVATESLAGHTPNVRTVNFLYFPNESENTVYFATSKNTDKVKELAANSQISFTTTPMSPQDASTVRVTGADTKMVNDRRSELFEAMDKKYASFKMFDQKARDNMNVYAATFKEAEVFGHGTDKISFN
ncbi:pyridoxamine 5'-phosphate oxidase family protein [Secundilactobacillus yichangensis]|uniref:pyridoxamine 5'-phosphate oxidase family protein n=1 Tax=Secundilactobacillus yichangensis TaxID=2799580 RepID=UPI0022A7FD50|nr:pyridoxamine 5'-phosphate oxidase family protein [Secundilactobacillus yichangensis]